MTLINKILSAALLILLVTPTRAEEPTDGASLDPQELNLSESASEAVAYNYCIFYPNLPDCYWYGYYRDDRDVGFVFQHLATRGYWGGHHHHKDRWHGHRRHDGGWRDHHGKFGRRGDFKSSHSRGHSLRSSSFSRGGDAKSFRSRSFSRRR